MAQKDRHDDRSAPSAASRSRQSIRYIAGYQAGAKKAVPGITTLNGYSQDFAAQDKCKNIALDQISQGLRRACSRSPAAAASAPSTRRRRRRRLGHRRRRRPGLREQARSDERAKKVDVAVYTAIAT